ncbi:MAG: hypothetical protein ABII12_01875 [Planctomycetota bacterium]
MNANLWIPILLVLLVGFTAPVAADVFDDEEARIAAFSLEELRAELAIIHDVAVFDQRWGPAAYVLKWDANTESVVVLRDGQAGTVTMDGLSFSASFSDPDGLAEGRLSFDSSGSLVFLQFVSSDAGLTAVCRPYEDGEVLPVTTEKLCQCLHPDSPLRKKKSSISEPTSPDGMALPPDGRSPKDTTAQKSMVGPHESICDDWQTNPCETPNSTVCGNTGDGSGRKYTCEWVTVGEEDCGSVSMFPLAAGICGMCLMYSFTSARRRRRKAHGRSR